MIDVAVAIWVLAAWFAFSFTVGPILGRWLARRQPGPHDTCLCGHGRVWHEHYATRTYCAACGCARFEIGAQS